MDEELWNCLCHGLLDVSSPWTSETETDNSMPLRAQSNAYGGGLLRDSLGVCWDGFVANFGRTSVLGAELLAVLQGLKLGSRPKGAMDPLEFLKLARCIYVIFY